MKASKHSCIISSYDIIHIMFIMKMVYNFPRISVARYNTVYTFTIKIIILMEVDTAILMYKEYATMRN